MTVDLSNQPLEMDAAGALAEIRSSTTELRKYTEDLLDRLCALADSLPAREEEHRRVLRGADREALDEQINRLSSLADELKELAAQQRSTPISAERTSR